MRVCLSGGLTCFSPLFLFVIPGRCAASIPESRDSGSGPSDHPGMTVGLVIIPRDAELAGDVVVARGQLHAGAGRLLADRRAIDSLPRRLACRVGEAALGFQFRMPLLHL